MLLPTIVITAAAVLLASSPIARAATLYTMTGRGFGHGVGMSQYGAYGYAKHSSKFRQILTHYYSGTTVTAVGNTTVRVLVRDGASRLTLVSSARLTLYDETTRRRRFVPAGHMAVTRPSGSKLRVVDASTGRTISEFAGPLRMSANGTPIRMITANANGESRLRYRGYFRLILRSGAVRAINQLTTEHYLRGVVPAEMPASWHIEALKAQAVAARSYALAKRRTGGDFDLYATTASQYYGAIDAERSRANSAIAGTSRLALKYGGAVIPAYFHSTSGGKTEDIQKVWGGSGLAWAKSVSDPYDDVSPYHSWRPVRYTPTRLDAALGNYVKGKLRGLAISATGTSPRVRTLRITGSGGVSSVTGSAIRTRLRLRSTWFAFRSMTIVSTTTIVPYGRTIAIIGRIRPAPAANAVGNRIVAFKARRIGATRWVNYRVSADSVGNVRRLIKPGAGTTYQFALGTAISPALTVRVRARVSLRASTAIPRVGQKVALSGTVSPNHASKLVTVKWYSSAGWKSYSLRRLSISSQYSTTFTPRQKGTFYFCTVFPPDANHLGGVSAVRKIVVK